ncbi:aminoglycoside 6-adenylyltransferase [Treponema sp. OttesenSCG-928-L16]|nr:aminoglycoside 6-adenylyltransferase [Treponema sp. OttesenSCG-928-L16]
MRSEDEMFELILSFARRDERVRLAALNGSRTNPNVPKDVFQDYDAVYAVTDMDSFKNDPNWVDYFGSRVIMQTPEAMSLFPPSLGNWFSYLMLFEDGNRIDLMLVPLEELDSYLYNDKLIRILLDKDGRAPSLPPPSDEDYHVKKPSAEFFDDCCNEFWWVSTYVVKGLCRGEFLYAADHLNSYVRPCLLRMLSWKAGIGTNFSVSMGKSYKYLDKYISKDEWDQLKSSCRCGSAEDIWNSLMECQKLFRQSSGFVSEQLAFPYPDYDAKVTAYTESIRASWPAAAGGA